MSGVLRYGINSTKRIFFIQCILRFFFRIHNFKQQLLRNLVNGSIEQNFALFQNQNGVDQAVQIAHLMRGDDNLPMLIRRGGHHLAENALGRNIQSVGRLIHEKVVVAILQVQVYYFLLLFLPGLAGYVLSLCMLAPMYPSENVFFFIKLIEWEGFGYNLLALTAGASVMLFASVYFRKLALLWSSLIGFAVIFVTIVIDTAIARFFDGMMVRSCQLSQSGVEAMYIMIFSLITLFFWFMTWLRLRETEV